MKVLFLHPAEIELDDAFEYYQSIMDGLGHRFIKEVSHSINRIKSFPSAYPTIGKASRRCLVRNFPYGLIYQEQENYILIPSLLSYFPLSEN